MSLVPWRTRPPTSLSALQQELNRMFDDLMAPMSSMTRSRGFDVVPALEVKEDETSVVVTAELPGVDSKDVQITVRGDVLEIKGEKSQANKREQDNMHIVERSYGSFMRRITLPREVDGDRAEASMDKGVLTLRIPKVDGEPGATSIPIK